MQICRTCCHASCLNEIVASWSFSLLGVLGPFEWAVVDEAGQITQPAALGPLMVARSFVLVGDDYQLPPLVISSEAREAGMDVSLFKRLGEAHPQAVTTLDTQYRMNAQIMEVCNVLVYEHRLRCGSAQVAASRLCLPSLASLPDPRAQPHNTPSKQAPFSPSAAAGATWAIPSTAQPRQDWLWRALHPDTCVLFLNTDLLFLDDSNHTIPQQPNGDTDHAEARPGPGNEQHESAENPLEAEVVALLIWGLRQAGAQMDSIGVVATYRRQVECIRAQLRRVWEAESTTLAKGRDGDSDGAEVSIGVEVSVCVCAILLGPVPV